MRPKWYVDLSVFEGCERKAHLTVGGVKLVQPDDRGRRNVTDQDWVVVLDGLKNQKQR